MASFWDQVSDFAEGAWETVSTGAGDALGKWADNGFGFGENGSEPQRRQGQPTTKEQPHLQPTHAQAAAGQVPANQQQAGLLSGLTTTQKMVGGGLVLGLVILAVK